MKLLAAFACLAFLNLPLAAQPSDSPRFEVASIKPSDPNPSNTAFIGMSADGAIVRYTNITLRDCIRGAFRVRDFQIVGPDWMTSSRFEITAKLPSGASSDEIPEMLQALLAERFKLTVDRQKKKQSVYALVVGATGAKLKPAEMKLDIQQPTALGPDGKPRAAMMYRIAADSVLVTAPAATIESFVGLMSRFTARPVIDMTGIQGTYQFSLEFAPEAGVPSTDGKPTSTEPAPSIFDAVKQYGFRIEARKAPIEMITVTNVDRTPTDN